MGLCEGRWSTVWSVGEILLSWLRGVHLLLLLDIGRTHGGREKGVVVG